MTGKLPRTIRNVTGEYSKWSAARVKLDTVTAAGYSLAGTSEIAVIVFAAIPRETPVVSYRPGRGGAVVPFELCLPD